MADGARRLTDQTGGATAGADAGRGADFDLRLALAVAVVKSQKWGSEGGREAKAKIRQLEEEVVLLRAEIDELKASALESLVPPVLCKCFAVGSGQDSGTRLGKRNSAAVSSLNENTVSKFLECLRVLNGCKKRRIGESTECENDRATQVAEMADFIVELLSCVNAQALTVWLHQAVEFVKSSVICLINTNDFSTARRTVKKLINSLAAKVTAFDPEKNPELLGLDIRPSIEKVLVHLAEVPLIGHQLLIEITAHLSIVSKALSQADPFGNGIAQLLENSYFLLDLVAHVLDDPLSSWIKDSKLDSGMLEEFISGFFDMKASMLGSRLNQLFVCYTDRICAQLMSQLHTIAPHADAELERIVTGSLQRLLGLASSALPS